MLYSSLIGRLRYRYFIVDLCSYIFSILLVANLKFHFKFSQLDIYSYFKILFITGIIYLGLLYFSGLYETDNILNIAYSKYFNANLYSAITFFILSFYMRDVSYSRVFFTAIYPTNLVLAIVIRLILTHYHKRTLGDTIKLPLVAIGFEMAPQEVFTQLKTNIGLRIILELPINKELESLVDSYKEIAVSFMGNDRKPLEKLGVLIYESETVQLHKLIEYCEFNYIPFYIVPNALGLLSVPLKIIDRKNLMLLGPKDNLVEGAVKRLKRFTDVIVALLGLILLSWLILIIWLAVKADSPGTGIYAHKRLGLNGKLTTIYKFRTMYSNSNEQLERLLQDEKIRKQYYNNFKIDNDPRITKLGVVLRKTSLDELPQLINILLGDISLVGPRPIIPEELSNYGSYASLILRVKPGLTGFWQVNGRSDVGYEERIRLDMYYIHNWSMILDFKILLLTVPIVLTKKGAS